MNTATRSTDVDRLHGELSEELSIFAVRENAGTFIWHGWGHTPQGIGGIAFACGTEFPVEAESPKRFKRIYKTCPDCLRALDDMADAIRQANARIEAAAESRPARVTRVK
ncbi:hypothetical protein HOT31_gp066 [Microbacterium phage Hendrix]|uniref:Uncharacterized protein n=1 Tax=Microbacterium phage Hendrix TaxID=2182341 RepID=A0A2U8UUI1_9CAUD|nr:hypothetical protein HOT31_gp066 [Microbacterium phage Hendrix]AWN07737.1 hypothetical protein PBI_HENDRIX_66 [Microbacterium phage Hendrix]